MSAEDDINDFLGVNKTPLVKISKPRKPTPIREITVTDFFSPHDYSIVYKALGRGFRQLSTLKRGMETSDLVCEYARIIAKMIEHNRISEIYVFSIFKS